MSGARMPLRRKMCTEKPPAAEIVELDAVDKVVGQMTNEDGRHFKAQYEFYAHARLAKQAGLSAEIVEAIRTRQTPPFKREQERIVYDFVTEYLATNRVSAPNYKRAIDAFGEPGVVDLVGVCGYYMLVSMTLNVFEMPLPAGVPDPLA